MQGRLPLPSLLLLAAILLAGCGTKGPPCKGGFPDLPIDASLVADAGPDFEAQGGAPVTFNATASLATSGGPFTYEWHQVSGPCARLDLTDPAMPVARTPDVDADAVLVYRLHLVRDGAMSAGDEAEVVVHP